MAKRGGTGPHVNDDIMTLEEVAAYLRLKPQTIYTWAQEKRIPAAKLGKEWRFKRSIVDTWFEQHIDEKFQDVVDKAKGKRTGGAGSSGR